MPTLEGIFYYVIQKFNSHIDLISFFVSNAYLFVLQKSQSYPNITAEPMLFVLNCKFNINSLYMPFSLKNTHTCLSVIFITDA